jgi:hypothetical protein
MAYPLVSVAGVVRGPSLPTSARLQALKRDYRHRPARPCAISLYTFCKVINLLAMRDWLNVVKYQPAAMLALPIRKI